MRNIYVAFLTACLLVINLSSVRGEPAMISEGKTVTFHYTLTVDGQKADSSEGKDPLEYVHGQHMIVEGLESQLTGLKAGDEKTVIVAAADGYGLEDPNLLIEVPKANLGPDIDPAVGMVLQMPTEAGRPIPGIITEVKDQSIIVNFNHPLAGKELTFAIKIVDVK